MLDKFRSVTMPNYVRPIFGNYLHNLRMLLVLHFTLQLLVFTRCAVVSDKYKVSDKYDKDVLKNKYCSQVGECTPGTHTVCMFGSDLNTMGPRCAEGNALPLKGSEKDFFLDIFNGFRADLASGKEILGKDNVTLPQAGGMMKLSWDVDLADLAQIWANQCDDRSRDLCRSTDQYPRAGQMVGKVWFGYPDWKPSGQKKLIDSRSGLTLEKRKYAIEKFAEKIFAARKDVTPDMIRRSVGSGHRNVYLMAVYGASTHIGCAMSAFLDYVRNFDKPTNIYYEVFLVCNFSSRPEDGKPVYNQTRPCGCPEGFKNENCLCVVGETTEKPSEKDGEPRKHEMEAPSQIKQKESKEEGVCPLRRPAVVVLPIIDVEDADWKLHQLQQELNLTTNAQRRQHIIRKKTRKRIKNDKDSNYKNHGFDPNTRSSNSGPVGQDSFVISQLDPDHSYPYVNRKARELELAFPTNLHNIQIKPKLEITELDEDLLHKHQNYNEGSQTDVANRIFNANNAAAKVYVSSINGNPVQYPFENFRKSMRPSTRTLPYGVQGFSDQGEPKIYVTSINGIPIKFHYDETFKKSQKPSTKLNRDLTYDVQDFSYKGPYMTVPNDYHDQLFNFLKNPEQKFKNVAYNSYNDELVQKNLYTIGEDITDKGNVVVKSTKEIQNGDVAEKFSSKVSVDNIGIENDYHVQLFNGLKTPEQILKDIAYNRYIDELAQKNLHTAGEDVIDNGNVVVTSTKQIQKGDVADSIGSKLYSTHNIYNKPRTIEAHIGNLPTRNKNPLHHVYNRITDRGNVVVKTGGSKVFSTHNIDNKTRNIEVQTGDSQIHIHAYDTVTDKGNVVVKSTKKIQKGDLAGNIGSKLFSTDNIDNEQTTIEAQIANSATRNQIPLYIHAYGTNNFDYYKHFHATKEYVKPRATLLNNKNDVGRRSGDTKDKASNGNNQRQKVIFVDDITKIVNYYLGVLKRLQSSKHHDE